jgi:hypothetical protein
VAGVWKVASHVVLQLSNWSGEAREEGETGVEGEAGVEGRGGESRGGVVKTACRAEQEEEAV